MKIALESGFTLLELMVTVAIAAIVLAMGVPSMRDMLQKNRMTSAANELMLSFQVARSEAIKRGQDVGIIAADPSDSSNEWGQGWTVWEDANNDTKKRLVRFSTISTRIAMMCCHC